MYILPSLAVGFLLATQLVLSATPMPARRDSIQRRSGPVSFPIYRRSQIVEGQETGLPSLKDLRAKRNAAIDRIVRRYYSPGSNKSKRVAETIPVSSFQEDNLYYATIKIGTPIQALDVQLDTGSSDLWVPTATCTTCNLSEVQPIFDNSQAAFLFNRSSTFSATTRPANITYGDQTAIGGIVATDVVSLGSSSFPQQTFIAAESETGVFNVAGLMGLAWTTLARSGGTPWWLNVLGQFESPEFSFSLAEWDAPSTAAIAPGGQFTLGGRNASMFDGDIQFVPLLQQNFWSIPLSSIFVPSTTGGPGTTLTPTQEESTAVIDSGSTIITGPQRLVDAFYAAVDGAVQGQTISADLQGQWLVPCGTTVNAKFTFGNVTVVLVAAELHRPPNLSPNITGYSQPLCLGSLTSAPGATTYPAWIMGDSLMKSTYCVFRAGTATTIASAAQSAVVGEVDGPAVGFAPLKGVQYDGNGNQIVGTNGDGVDGRVGNAGASAVVTGSGNGETNSPVTQTVQPGSSPTPTTSSRSNAAPLMTLAVHGRLGLVLVAGLSSALVSLTY